MKKSTKQIIGISFATVVILFLLLSLAVNTARKDAEFIEEKMDGRSLIELIGEGSRQVKEEFNKGYHKQDSVKTDSIQAKKSKKIE